MPGYYRIIIVFDCDERVDDNGLLAFSRGGSKRLIVQELCAGIGVRAMYGGANRNRYVRFVNVTGDDIAAAPGRDSCTAAGGFDYTFFIMIIRIFTGNPCVEITAFKCDSREDHKTHIHVWYKYDI